MSAPDLATELITALSQQTAPATAVQLAKQLPIKASAKAVTGALNELANVGRITAFTMGKGTAYAMRPPLDMCADALVPIIAAQSSAVAPARLKAALPTTLRAWFDEALARLIVKGKAFWLPKGKTKLVQGRAVRASDLMSKAQLASLEKLLVEVNRRRRAPRRLSQLLAWLDADTIDRGGVANPTDAQLKAWYRLDRAQSSSSMIELPRTWLRYEAWAKSQQLATDVDLFRDAITAMYESCQAELEPCERPQDLSAEDRALQVPLSLGPPGFYWKPTSV